MDGCICSVKKSHYMKESMAQADPPKEASRVKKKNGRLLPISSNECKWFSEKYLLSLQKCGASNKFSNQ